MAAGFVKQQLGGSSTASTTGSVTVAAPAAGNLLVACIALGSSTSTAQVSSITSTGATWTNVARSAMNATTSVRQEIWVGSGDTGTALTVNFSASSKFSANVSEWSGLETTVDVTAITTTGAVTSGTHTTSSTALSNTPGGDLVIGAMALALSNASTDFTAATTGSPDTATPLTWSGSGATTSANVGMQSVYDVASKGLIAPTFTWTTGAAWQYAWAAVSLRAKARTFDMTTPTITGTVGRAQTVAHGVAATCTPTVAFAKALAGLARAVFSASCTVTVSFGRGFGFARSSFTPSLTGTVAHAQAIAHPLASTMTETVSVARTSGKALSAPITQTVALARRTAPSLAASCTATVARTQDVAHTATAMIAPTMTLLSEDVLFLMVSALAATAAVRRDVTDVLTGLVAGAGSVRRSVGRALSAACTGVGAFSRGCVRAIVSALQSRPTLGKDLHLGIASFAASVTGAAGVVRRAGKGLAATEGTGASLSRHALSVFAASLQGLGTLAAGTAGSIVAAFSSVLQVSGARTVGVGRTVGAGTSTLAAILGQGSHLVLAARVSGAATLARDVAGHLRARVAAATALGRAFAPTRTLFAATVDGAGALARMATRRMSATSAVTATVVRGVAKAESVVLRAAPATAHGVATAPGGAALPLRGPTKALALWHPLIRATTRLPARLFMLVAPPRLRMRYALGARTFAYAAPPRLYAVVRKEGLMQMLPAATGSARLGPTEKNVSFACNFSAALPTGTSITSYVATVTDLDAGADVTDSLLQTDHLAGTVVTVTLGDGTQTRGALYRVRIVVTLNNTPATELEGYFDVPCTEIA